MVRKGLCKVKENEKAEKIEMRFRGACHWSRISSSCISDFLMLAFKLVHNFDVPFLKGTFELFA